MKKLLLAAASAAALTLGSGIGVASTLSAQAPAVSPAGDPTIDADSIYRLPNPKWVAKDAYSVTLFEDDIIRVESDYRTTRTTRAISRRLAPPDTWPNRGYTIAMADRGATVRLNWARVVAPNGTTVAQAAPASMRKESAERTESWRVDLPKLRPGDIMDYSYTVVEPPPASRELYMEFNPDAVVRARRIVDVPAGMPLRVSERNLQHPRRESTVAGRRTLTWTARDVDLSLWSGSPDEVRNRQLEPYAPDSLTRHPQVTVSSGKTWKQVGDDFRASIPKSQYAFDAGAMKAFDDDTYLHLSKSYIDTVATVHGWLSMDYELDYERDDFGGVTLGRTANQLARDTTGTQEELVMLFIAAARAHGIRAYPVLIGSYETDSTHPSRHQLTRLGAWVETKLPQMPWLYRDPSTPQSFFTGEHPVAQQGQFGLVIFDDSVKHITLDRTSPGGNATLTSLSGTLALDGSLKGRVRYEARGSAGYSLNSELERGRANGGRSRAGTIPTSLYPNTKADSVSAVGPWMQTPNPTVTASVSVPSVGRRSGSTFVLDLFWKPLAGLDSMAAFLERTPRKMPIDAEKVVGATAWAKSISIRLPAGWTARLPQPLKAESPFGTFETRYAQKDGVLTASQVMIGARGVHGPEKARELAQWLRRLMTDRTSQIVIDVR